MWKLQKSLPEDAGYNNLNIRLQHRRGLFAAVVGSFRLDNGTREGQDKFLKAASTKPETVLHEELMQDYKALDIIPVA
ncbi:unnamed protein product [Citrullus colocynthis]|uniref:Uncharacterized protein n=1 Tax=Citrullus colocynthis TaxID=252529 RepID=A0ABP0YJ88_9ROSI